MSFGNCDKAFQGNGQLALLRVSIQCLPVLAAGQGASLQTHSTQTECHGQELQSWALHAGQEASCILHTYRLACLSDDKAGRAWNPCEAVCPASVSPVLAADMMQAQVARSCRPTSLLARLDLLAYCQEPQIMIGEAATLP